VRGGQGEIGELQPGEGRSLQSWPRCLGHRSVLPRLADYMNGQEKKKKRKKTFLG
jgi:hypothetical protein